MTETTYHYDYDDFFQNVNTTELASQIEAIRDETWPLLVSIYVDFEDIPVSVDIVFSDALSELQNSELDACVAAYIAMIKVYGDVYFQAGQLHFDDGLGHIYSFTPSV